MWHGQEDNSPIRYILEQDPVQHALEKNKTTMYFKLKLPNTWNNLKVAIWANGTPEEYLLHVHTAAHVCKQNSLDTKEANVIMALEAVYCELDATKVENTMLAKTIRKNTKEQKENDENPAPNVQKKAKKPKEKGETLHLLSTLMHLS